MSLLAFVVTPVAGGVIGYATNWIAIKMLFRPHEPKRLFGRQLPFTPGLIPKERYNLAAKVGKTAAENVLTPEVIEEALSKPEVVEKLRAAAESAVDALFDAETGGLAALTGLADEGLGERAAAAILSLRTANPELDAKLRGIVRQIAEENVGTLAKLFINYDKLYESIRDKVCLVLTDKEAASKLGSLAASVTGENMGLIKEKAGEAVIFGIRRGGKAISNSLDFAKIIEERINALDVPQTEEIIISVVKRELSAITMVGGVLGFVIGLVPAALSLLG